MYPPISIIAPIPTCGSLVAAARDSVFVHSNSWRRSSWRHAEHVGDDPQRQFDGDVVDEITLASSRSRVDEAGDVRADGLLFLPDQLGSEDSLHDIAVLGVARRVHAEDDFRQHLGRNRALRRS